MHALILVVSTSFFPVYMYMLLPTFFWGRCSRAFLEFSGVWRLTSKAGELLLWKILLEDIMHLRCTTLKTNMACYSHPLVRKTCRTAESWQLHHKNIRRFPKFCLLLNSKVHVVFTLPKLTSITKPFKIIFLFCLLSIQGGTCKGSLERWPTVHLGHVLILRSLVLGHEKNIH